MTERGKKGERVKGIGKGKGEMKKIRKISWVYKNNKCLKRRHSNCYKKGLKLIMSLRPG